MARYDPQQSRDTPLETAQDRGWRGVNMRLEPEQLEPGWASEAVNHRFRYGIPETRGGLLRLSWMQKIDTGTVPASILPWGIIQGMERYSDPSTNQDYLIVVAAGVAYGVTQNNIWQPISLPAGETIPERVRFTQCFNVLVMWRGKTQQPLTLTGVAAGFQLITPTPSGSGALSIPSAERGIFVGGRLWTHDGDVVYASDIQDYTRYSPFNSWRINAGSNDQITCLAKFNDNTIIVFKERSIYALQGAVGAIDQSGTLAEIRIDLTTSQYGCIAPDSVQQAGADFWFLSHLGVMSLRQTETNALQSTTIPVSDAIHPLIERINWAYVGNVVSGYWDSKYYLAVPLDAAEGVRADRVAGTVVTAGGPTPAVIGGLTIGRTYRWIKADDDSQIVCGSITLTSTGNFVAGATTATITNVPGDTVITSQVYEVFLGVNTAVLVFDFMAQAWAGMDTADGIEVKHMVRFLDGAKERLFVSTPDGWIYLYEEGYEDQVSQPYVDVRVVSAPAFLNAIQVNNGVTITVTTVNQPNTATVLSAQNLPAAQQNIWKNGTYAYSAQNPTPWSAPNTWSRQTVSDTIRFYGTNGLVPAVITTGTWITTTDGGWQGIPTKLVTRGYSLPSGLLQAVRWCSVHVQTLNPTFTIEALSDGVNEVESQTVGMTKSRVAYYEPWDQADWNSANANDDFMNPLRQDYSLRLGTGALDSPGILMGSGVRTDLHQEVRQSFSTNLANRSVRLRITNATGRIRIMRILVDSFGFNVKGGAQA